MSMVNFILKGSDLCVKWFLKIICVISFNITVIHIDHMIKELINLLIVPQQNYKSWMVTVRIWPNYIDHHLMQKFIKTRVSSCLQVLIGGIRTQAFWLLLKIKVIVDHVGLFQQLLLSNHIGLSQQDNYGAYLNNK